MIAFGPELDEEQRSALIDAGANGYVLATIDDASLSVVLEAIAELVGPDRTGKRNGGRQGSGPGSPFLSSTPSG